MAKLALGICCKQTSRTLSTDLYCDLAACRYDQCILSLGFQISFQLRILTILRKKQAGLFERQSEPKAYGIVDHQIKNEKNTPHGLFHLELYEISFLNCQNLSIIYESGSSPPNRLGAFSEKMASLYQTSHKNRKLSTCRGL